MGKFITRIENIYNIHVEFLGKCDEAELKLKKKLMDNVNLNPKSTNIIITNDADVVLMLSTLENPTNTYIFNKNLKNIEIISIGELLLAHGASLSPNPNPNPNPVSNLDFTCVNMLMGNDYLPKLYGLTFDKLWNGYKYVLKFIKSGLVDPINKSINKLFFKCLLITINNTVRQPKPSDKLTIANLFNKTYSNYMDGYTWCIHIYITGICSRYNYMYESNSIPSPLGLAINIDLNPELLKVNTSINPPLNKELYAMLLLPYKYTNLIDSKYIKFIENQPILYSKSDITLPQILNLIDLFNKFVNL